MSDTRAMDIRLRSHGAEIIARVRKADNDMGLAADRILELEAVRDRLAKEVAGIRAALDGGLRKLETYQHIYSGDKELQRLLDEWRALSRSTEE